jgi:hypothetical protein
MTSILEKHVSIEVPCIRMMDGFRTLENLELTTSYSPLFKYERNTDAGVSNSCKIPMIVGNKPWHILWARDATLCMHDASLDG